MLVDGRQIKLRSSSSDTLGRTDEVLVAADTRELATADGVGHDLAGRGRCARAPLIVTMLAVLRDQLRRVDHTDGQEPHVVVAVEPVVQLAHAGGKGGDREAVERRLCGW